MYYAKYLGHRSNVGRFFTNLVWGSLCSLMLTRACRLSKLCHKALGGGSWGVPRGSPVPGHCAQRPLRAAALARRFARGCAEPQAEGGSSCFPRTEQLAQLPQICKADLVCSAAEWTRDYFSLTYPSLLRAKMLISSLFQLNFVTAL